MPADNLIYDWNLEKPSLCKPVRRISLYDETLRDGWPRRSR